MQRKFILIILFISIFAFSSLAKGIYSIKSTSDSIDLLLIKPFKNSFNIGLTYSHALGAFTNSVNQDISLKDNLEGKSGGGMGMTSALGFKISSSFFFSKKPRRSSFGLNVDFLKFNYFKFDLGIGTPLEIKSVRYISFGLGPAWSRRVDLSMKNTCLFNISFLASPVFSRNGYEEISYQIANGTDVGYFNLNNGFGFQYTTECGLNFKHIGIAASYTFGNINYKEASYYEFAHISTPDYEVHAMGNSTTNAKVHTNFFSLLLAIRFGGN